MFLFSFLLCNLGICLVIGLILAIRRIFYIPLSSQMRYRLWFLLLGLLAVPFLPFQIRGWAGFLSRLATIQPPSFSEMEVISQATAPLAAENTGEWLRDFSVSVDRHTAGIFMILLLGIWLGGIVISLFYMVRSSIYLHRIRQSALPLENPKIRDLYDQCLREARVRKYIPVYSTSFLQSPVITGCLTPRSYLPLSLISEGDCRQLRYILLHELQHYKHRDAAANALAALAGMVYWFHPLVRYALREMKNDREVACDTAVLHLLKEQEYTDYGNTLLHFAQKISRHPGPFAAGIGGNKKQMQKRIINIISYESPTKGKRIKSGVIFCITALILSTLAPLLSIRAAREERDHWQKEGACVSYIEGTPDSFRGVQGSFVLYDFSRDAWQIYNPRRATLRTSPNSTYKIYAALLALESDLITPQDSKMEWNQKTYPIEAWNGDQDLHSALQNSVNWYFQSLDARLGKNAIRQFIQKIGYGNQNLSGDLSSYWMESSLKISPIEQVELLRRLYFNDFIFSAENIQAVKDSLLLTSTSAGSLFGKTGTGQINGKNVNGWFIGWVEASDGAYFFAVNIQADDGADGTRASQIALSMLSDLQIWYDHA